MSRLRLFAIPFSTNVERVALALGHKRLDAELVMCEPADRGPIRAVSGQDLVPVLDDGGTIITDSSRIIEYLEAIHPQPPLFPTDPALRARMRIFVSWFDRVWKHAPNAIEAELRRPQPDRARIDLLAGEMRSWNDLLEQMLSGRDYLAGDHFTAADCAAFPFYRYLRGADPGDDELFHQVLAERLAGCGPPLRAWVERVDGRPRRPAGI